jgi:hypothetical protein
MKRAKQTRMFTDIGFVGLPILCCLLAGVIFISADAMRQAQEGRGPEQDSFRHQQEVARLALRVTAAETNLVDSRKRLDTAELAATDRQKIESLLAQYRETIAELEMEIEQWTQIKEKLENQVDQNKMLQAETQRLLEEIDRVNKQIAATQKRIDALKSKVGDDSRPWFGGYTGRYVLVECTAKGATVYAPGGNRKRQLAIKPTASESNWLFNEIERAGFVVLLARPSSFEDTFDKFRKLVRDHLKSVNSKGGPKRIGRFDLPAEANEPIEKYLWKGD